MGWSLSLSPLEVVGGGRVIVIAGAVLVAVVDVEVGVVVHHVSCIIAVNNARGESVSDVCTTGGTHLSWPSSSHTWVLGLRKILKCCDL